MSSKDPNPIPPTHTPKPDGSPGMPGEVGGEGRSSGTGSGGDGGDDSKRTPRDEDH